MYTKEQEYEATQLHRILLRHTGELNLCTAYFGGKDIVHTLNHKIEVLGGAEYLKKELEKSGTESGLGLLLDWYEGKIALDEINEEIDQFITDQLRIRSHTNEIKEDL